MYDDLNPPIVFSIPHEKWIYRVGKAWDISNPVKKLGAEMHLVSLGWPAIQAHMFMKMPDVHVSVHSIDMRPNEGPVCEDEHGRLVLNLWAPPTLVPKAGPFPTIERAIDHVTAGDAVGKTWLIHWLARKVQQPEVVPKVAAIFSTSQGAGKGFLARVVSEILGPENCAIVKQHELASNFNKRWVRKLFVLGDEVISNENIKDISQLLKILVDGGELELEGKYENQTAVRSRLAWMFASNDHISPLALEGSDRRYTFFSNFDAVDPEYTTALNACFEADRVTVTPAFREEIAGFADYLHSVAVDLALVSRPHHNAARETLIESNMQSHETFCAEVREHGFYVLYEDMRREDLSISDDDKRRNEWDFGENGIATWMLYKTYRHYCKRTGQYPLRLNKFGGALKNHARWVPTTNSVDLANRAGDKKARQVRCYVVPLGVTK